MFASNIKFFQKAIVLHPEGGRFLALKRQLHDSSPGLWDFPGGGVEFGELHTPALEREIWEESGLAIAASAVVEVMTKFDTAQGIYSIFVAHQCVATSSDVRLSDEHSEYRWVTPTEWQAMDTLPSLKQVVRVYESRKHYDNNP